MFRCVAVCYMVLQCCVRLFAFLLLVCCNVLQCVAVYCSALQCVAVCRSVLQGVAGIAVFGEALSRLSSGVLQCVAVCCRVLQGVAGCCSVA